MKTEAERIAATLTKAQRAYLTVKAVWRDPTGFSGERWMAFPPPNTHSVLMRLGLMDQKGSIKPLGFEVRTILERKSDEAW